MIQRKRSHMFYFPLAKRSIYIFELVSYSFRNSTWTLICSWKKRFRRRIQCWVERTRASAACSRRTTSGARRSAPRCCRRARALQKKRERRKGGGRGNRGSKERTHTHAHKRGTSKRNFVTIWEWHRMIMFQSGVFAMHCKKEDGKKRKVFAFFRRKTIFGC